MQGSVFLSALPVLLLLGCNPGASPPSPARAVTATSTDGTLVIHEDQARGFPERLQISDLKRSDIAPGGREHKGEVVQWDLLVDQGRRTFTDVVGSDHIRWMVEVKAESPELLPIRMDHQGGDPPFWMAIQAGEKIRVVGEVDVVTWFHPIEKRSLTENWLLPLAVRHGNEIYLGTVFPAAMRAQVLDALK